MALMRSQRSEQRSPLEELSRLREEMDRLFAGPFIDFGRSFAEWAPAIDVYEDRDNVTVRAEVPGMKKEDIDVSLHNNTLTISGERKQENKDAQMHRSERFIGRFSRSITLPTSVDSGKVKAAYKEGILTITLPKTEEAKPRQIEISVK